jgi:hypothetical protein
MLFIRKSLETIFTVCINYLVLKKLPGQARQHVTSALGRLRHEYHEFEATLDYIVSSR